MRHVWSLIAGLVAAPVVWVLLALGQAGSTRTISIWDTNRLIQQASDPAAAPAFDAVDLVGPAAFLAAAGVILGLLATLRISPVGPLVAGLFLATPYVAMFVDPFTVLDYVPRDDRLAGQTISMLIPLYNGTLLVVGVLLLMAVFSVQRWRGRPAVAPVAYPPGDEGKAPEPGAPPPEAPEAAWARPSGTESEPATVPIGSAQAAAPQAERSASEGEPSAAPDAGRPPEPEWPPPPPPDRPAEAPGHPAPPAESPWIAPPRSTHRDPAE